MEHPNGDAYRHSSPKRKREDINPSQHVTDVPHILTNLKDSSLVARSDDDPISGDGSPHSKVASRLQRLNLHHNLLHPEDDTEPAKKRLFLPSELDEKPDTVNTSTKRSAAHQMTTPNGARMAPEFQPPKSPSFAFSDSTMTPDVLSQRRRGSRSPPLDGDPEENPLTWHESEITGHNPSDPADDGYGINGIGFRPTPAIAWARSQKRKQQLADYRSREAKEARQRRNERRRIDSISLVSSRLDQEPTDSVSRGSDRLDQEPTDSVSRGSDRLDQEPNLKTARVRFEDG